MKRDTNENPRLVKLLALILLETMRDATQTQKALRLNSVGFTGKEIAELLGTSPEVVRQNLYVARMVGRRSTKLKKTGKSKKASQHK